jgi:hypothetical protein
MNAIPSQSAQGRDAAEISAEVARLKACKASLGGSELTETAAAVRALEEKWTEDGVDCDGYFDHLGLVARISAEEAAKAAIRWRDSNDEMPSAIWEEYLAESGRTLAAAVVRPPEALPAAEANVTKDGVLVKPGQVWQDLDKRMSGRKVKIVRVEAGVAYFERRGGLGKPGRLAVRRMHKASTGFALVPESQP